jgi:hypothetical protein
MTPGYQRRPAGNYRSCGVQELWLVASGGYEAAELGKKSVILPPGGADSSHIVAGARDAGRWLSSRRGRKRPIRGIRRSRCCPRRRSGRSRSWPRPLREGCAGSRYLAVP